MSDIWLPLIPQVLVQLLCPVHSTGLCGGIGARIVFGLSATRMMTYTLVAAAWRSSLIWNQGALQSRPAPSAAEASPLASRACASASPRPVLREPKERRGTCRRCTGRPASRTRPLPFPEAPGPLRRSPALRNSKGLPAWVPPRRSACRQSSAALSTLGRWPGCAR